MKISLVIPAHNEESYIGSCIEHAIRNSKGKLHEIIVVDNASTDKTREVAESKGVKVVYEGKKGTNAARERGLKEATGDFVAFFDADTRMPDFWLEKAEEVFAARPKAVCLSGPYRYYDGSMWENMIMNTLWYLTAPLMYRIVGYMVLGGNFIVKREALLGIGGFDTSIGFYGDDTDIARSLSAAGKVVFRMDFFIYSSSRRLRKEGLTMPNIRYGMNFIWGVLFHRPFTKSSTDIRIK